MARRMSQSKRKAAFLAAAKETHEALERWYDAHPEATVGELELGARRRRRSLMGQALEVLVNGRDTGMQAKGAISRLWGLDGFQGLAALDGIRTGWGCAARASLLRLSWV